MESDEFNGAGIGLQWQWMSNPLATWAYAAPGQGLLRLYAHKLPEGAKNLWEGGQVLSQKFPADSFQATVKLTFMPNRKGLGEKAGLAIMGLSYAGIAVKHTPAGNELVYFESPDAGKGGKENERSLGATKDSVFYFRVQVFTGARCRFQYSTDGKNFKDAGATFTATVGRWKGAKMGLFCTRTETTNDSGWADLDWFRVTPLSN
jgi:hypothetical protein